MCRTDRCLVPSEAHIKPPPDSVHAVLWLFVLPGNTKQSTLLLLQILSQPCQFSVAARGFLWASDRGQTWSRSWIGDRRIWMTLSHCRKVPANETCPWDSPSHTQTTTTTPPPSSSSTTTTTIAPAPAKDSIGGGAGGGGAAGPSDSEATGSGSQGQGYQARGDREYQMLPQLRSCQFLLNHLIFTAEPRPSLHSSSLLDQHSLLGLRQRPPLQPGRPRGGGAPPRGWPPEQAEEEIQQRHCRGGDHRKENQQELQRGHGQRGRYGDGLCQHRHRQRGLLVRGRQHQEGLQGEQLLRWGGHGRKQGADDQSQPW